MELDIDLDLTELLGVEDYETITFLAFPTIDRESMEYFVPEGDVWCRISHLEMERMLVVFVWLQDPKNQIYIDNLFTAAAKKEDSDDRF